MTERRQDQISKERRAARRTVLSEFMSAFVVLPQRGLQRVDLYDVSKKGVSFDVPFEHGKLNIDEKIALRFYLSQTTYFPIVVKVSNTRHIPEEGIYRHGSVFEVSQDSEEPLKHLVNFIETVSRQLHSDKGDLMFSKK